MPENKEEEKQHTPEFEDCIQRVMKQGHEKGSAFAICTTTFQKADKPLYVGEAETQKLHLFSESVGVSGNKVSGVCIHPKRIFHPEEGLEHVYLKEELEKAAQTLIGKPFGIDHLQVLPPPNMITNSWYDSAENGVAYEGTVDDEVAEKIRNKEFKGVSIELNWLRPGGKVEYMNGVAPRSFELTSVHLLRKFPPGDKDAYIKFWNAVVEQLVVSPAQTLDQKVAALIERFESFTDWVNERLAKVEGTIAGFAMKPALAEPTEKAVEAEKTKLEPIEIVALRKDLVNSQAALGEAEKRIKVEKQRFARFHEAVEGTLPDRATELRWLGSGPKVFAERVKRVLHEFQPL
jgi:hypothetical protein